MEQNVCSSCKKKVVNDKGWARFDCPKCGQLKILRCSNCRSNAVKYTCSACGFIGPN